jgi:hypothetical protein
MPKHRAVRSPQRAAREARVSRANQKAADLAPIIAELRAAGITSLRGIAAALNERSILTVAGSGRWSHTQVARLLARLAGLRRGRRPPP